MSPGMQEDKVSLYRPLRQRNAISIKLDVSQGQISVKLIDRNIGTKGVIHILCIVIE